MRRERVMCGRATLGRRRGVASILAMMYLTLFAALAIGFYATVTTAVQVSNNDQRVTRAMVAADSGMDFMRYELAHVTIPPNTQPSQVINELFKDLQKHVDKTSNVGTTTIAQSGNTVNIPGPAERYIALDAAGETGFRATITDWAGEIVVKVTGRYATAAAGTPAVRAITMDFTRQNLPTSTFNYAVASKGGVVVSKGS